MAEAVITFAGEANMGGYGDLYPFKPCLLVHYGHKDFRAWIQLTDMTGEILRRQLEALQLADADDLIKKAMLRYGIRRLEPIVQEIVSNDIIAEAIHPTWKLDEGDRALLLRLATSKTCEYQRSISRDLFCMISSINDTTAVTDIEGRKVSATSRSICFRCNLPDTDFLCSHLLHAATTGTMPRYGRRVSQALCDLDRAEVKQPWACHLGGHSCSQRILEIDIYRPTTPQLSALSIPESFDVLDAHWRLAFGRAERLLIPSTLTGPSSLVLNCSSNSPDCPVRLRRWSVFVADRAWRVVRRFCMMWRACSVSR